MAFGTPRAGVSTRRVATGVVTASALVASVPAYYLGALTVLGVRPHRCGRSVGQRFAIVVPAHDEAGSIAGTLSSLAALKYPAELVEVVVVADNCSDDTADRARAAGATVLERHDDERRGKGYALELAFDTLIERDMFDAVVVIDADTLVDDHLLSHAAAHLDAGAAAIQVDYRIRNPEASWRTTLADLAFTCKHRVRSRGRDAVGASAGLRGNGMIFSVDTLRQQPYAAFSVVEDVEYAIDLAQRDIAVQSCDSTFVGGDMPATAESAESQRVRWELGNRMLRREHGWPLVSRAVRSRKVVHADMAADVMLPPLATVGAALGVATAGTAALRIATRRGVGSIIPSSLITVAWAALVVHVAAGVALSQSTWRCLPALARVPFYMAWKVSVRGSAAWREQNDGEPVWSRTDRSESTLAAETTNEPTRLVSA